MSGKPDPITLAVREILKTVFITGRDCIDDGVFDHSELPQLWRAILEKNFGWQDIATAPRDGSELILWPAIRNPIDGEIPSASGRWAKYGDMECWDDLAVGHHNGFWQPTHWMPLPAPPKENDDD